jgi:hypothetical protein
MTDRIDNIEERLRTVEQAVVELGIVARYAKYAVMILAATLGLDLGVMM